MGEDEEDLGEIQDSWDTRVKLDQLDPKEAEVCQDTVDHQEIRDPKVSQDQQVYQDQQENRDLKVSQEQTDKLERVETQDHQVYQVHQPSHHGWEVVFQMVQRREVTKRTVEAMRKRHQRKNLQRTTPSTLSTDSTLQTNLKV